MGNTQKSHGTKSGELGAWMRFHPSTSSHSINPAALEALLVVLAAIVAPATTLEQLLLAELAAPQLLVALAAVVDLIALLGLPSSESIVSCANPCSKTRDAYMTDFTEASLKLG